MALGLMHNLSFVGAKPLRHTDNALIDSAGSLARAREETKAIPVESHTILLVFSPVFRVVATVT